MASEEEGLWWRQDEPLKSDGGGTEEEEEQERAGSSSQILLLLLIPPLVLSRLQRLSPPLELELLGHFGGDVSEGQGCPPQALEPHPAALAQPAGQLADLRLEGHTGAGGAMGAGQQEGPRQVDLATAALRRLAQGQHHLGRVAGAPHPHIPAASGGPGLGRFLMPR